MSDDDVAEDWCDYCKGALGDSYMLRAIGFTEYLGGVHPLVKTWCEECEPGDETDPEAEAALLLAINARLGVLQ